MEKLQLNGLIELADPVLTRVGLRFQRVHQFYQAEGCLKEAGLCLGGAAERSYSENDLS